MSESDAVLGFGALASTIRLRLLTLLVQTDAEGLTPSHLSQVFGVPMATLSFHLKELQRAGLVTSRPLGRQRLYRVSRSRMVSLGEHLQHGLGPMPSCEPAEAQEAAVDPMHPG